MTGSSHANQKQWAVGCRLTLLQVHSHNPGRVSYETACMALAEINEFIIEYHGRDTAVATLERLAMAIEAKLPLPAFTPIGTPVMAPAAAPREFDRWVGRRLAHWMRTDGRLFLVCLGVVVAVSAALAHFFP